MNWFTILIWIFFIILGLFGLIAFPFLMKEGTKIPKDEEEYDWFYENREKSNVNKKEKENEKIVNEVEIDENDDLINKITLREEITEKENKLLKEIEQEINELKEILRNDIIKKERKLLKEFQEKYSLR